MTVAVSVIVIAGLMAALALGIATSFDVASVLMLAVLAMLGALGIAAAVRAKRGTVAPGRCSECGGLVSPSAPHCKHCGAQLD